jgi:hypothetical protein
MGLPGEVDDLLVREDGVGVRRLRGRYEKRDERECKDSAATGGTLNHTG